MTTLKREGFKVPSETFKVSPDEANEAFANAMPWLKSVVEITTMMRELTKGEWDDDLEMDIVDVIVDNEDTYQITKLNNLMAKPIGKTEAISDIQQTLIPLPNSGEEPLQELLVKLFKDIALNYALPTVKVTQNLATMLNSYTNRLVYFIYYQFEMNKYQIGVISEPVYQYAMKSENGEIDKFMKEMDELAVRFRPQLEVFDEYPELEDAFFEVAEVYMENLDLFTATLTYQEVVSVINSKDPESELTRLHSKYRG